MIVGLAAYLLQDWYTLQQTMSGIILGLVILWYFMPESPRWLLSKSNKYQEAIKVLTNGAKYNRRPLPEGFLRYDDGTFRVSILHIWELFLETTCNVFIDGEYDARGAIRFKILISTFLHGTHLFCSVSKLDYSHHVLLWIDHAICQSNG